MLLIEQKDRTIVEATYREILAGYDGPVSRNSAVSVKFNTIEPETRRLSFTAHDFNGSNKPHIVQIQLDKTLNMKPASKDKVKDAIMNGNIQYHCDCGSYLYGGFKYISSRKKDTALEPETRFPRIRNPKRLGLVCKHIHAVVDELPHLVDPITKVFAFIGKEDVERKRLNPLKTAANWIKDKFKRRHSGLA